MDDALFKTEKLKYERIHAVPGYSLGPGASHVATFLSYIKPGESVIDFGCGTGDAARKLADLGHPVHLVDIVKDPLRHDLPFYEGSLHALPADLPRADWGFCCDVMEHLPEEWIPAAMAGMKSKVNKIFFAICGAPDGWGHHINDTLHLTVKPFEWWDNHIRKYWPSTTPMADQGSVYMLVAADLWAAELQRRFDLIWDGDVYRQGSMEKRMVPFILEWIQPGMMVNDYCCGTGRAVSDYVKAGINQINLVDISAIALEPETRALINGNGITFTQASIWDLPADFPRTPWGLCIDALMCLPPERLDDSLTAIRRTCDNLIVEVYDWDYVKFNTNYTATVGSEKFWRKKLLQYFPDVERYPSEADRRYVFVCKGGTE